MAIRIKLFGDFAAYRIEALSLAYTCLDLQTRCYYSVQQLIQANDAINITCETIFLSHIEFSAQANQSLSLSNKYYPWDGHCHKPQQRLLSLESVYQSGVYSYHYELEPMLDIVTDEAKGYWVVS